MAIHDWKQAPPGFFHHFHQQWSAALCASLNAGGLPPGYFALIELTTFGVAPDLIALQNRTPPLPSSGRCGAIALAERPPVTRFVSRSNDEQGYAARANRVAIRNASRDVVAVIEIVSPGNKNSRTAVRSVVDKAIDLLRQGINLLMIDLFPPGPRDPEGINALIWNELTAESMMLPSDKRLSLAAFVAGIELRTFMEPVAVGDALPDMPLFLDRESYVPAPLETSYQDSWNACPEEFRELVIGPPPDASAPEEDAL